LQDPGREIWSTAAVALWKIDRQSQAVVPVLLNVLKDPYPIAGQVYAAGALGQMGAGAKAAVPALLQARKEPDHELRAAAGRALRQIDPGAADKAGVPLDAAAQPK
jgi:HEAT repeat protein